MGEGKRGNPARLFLEEILLYSGQFGLFYIVMQLIIEGAGFFANVGHLVLLIALVAQALILARLGDIVIYRFAFSFFVPLVYSAFELNEGSAYLLNAAHTGFWVYALMSSSLMAIKARGGRVSSKLSESILVVLNIVIFIFIYFYFDTWKDIRENSLLTVLRIFDYIPAFLDDPTHWFIISGGTALAITVALGRYEVSSLKDKIYSLFGQYVDRRVRDTVIERGRMESRREKLCVLFSDIKGFTVLCENHDPGAITEMLNAYFEQWNEVVNKYDGTIDKYIGDAIMVIFGLRGAAGACTSAVSCAIEMVDLWPASRSQLARKGLPVPDGFGIGCHFGDLIVGDIGSNDRKSFTAIGDTVNIAARLESATRRAQSDLLVSSSVYSELDNSQRTRFKRIGRLSLKGKTECIETWGIPRLPPLL